jgi:hypothetical protein
MIQDVPFLPLESLPGRVATQDRARVQAGLLTSGSSAFRAFPFTQWHDAEFVPGYSGGPVPALHRIPFSSVVDGHLNDSAGNGTCRIR